MSLEENERAELIRYRIEEAKETIADVQLLIDNDRLRAAVNRIYYGMFYSLLALGLAYQFETSKHQQLLGWFNKNFIHEGLIDVKFGKIINKAFNRRTQGDYESYVEFDKEIILEMFDEMKEFISEVEQFLNRT
ncbi:MAG: HEPN domain-containing protein [Prolixibacteraceae bacterium]|nr:HEPN domain-containing protein [Prolixibacteraceae bacterium]